MGMGLDELVVLPMEPSQDPAPLLAGWLTLNPCSLIFSGAKAETGDGSGIVPYHVAHLLGAEVVPSIVEIHQKTSGTSVLQALPGGRRRIISIEACVVATVDSATQAVQIARAVAKRSETTPGVAVVSAQAPTLVPTPLTITTAKRMPKRIGPVSLGAKAPGQKLIQNCSAQQAAKEILQFLATERLLDSSDLANLPD
jgi:electron transfer flavoprotein beta subunit